MKKGELFFLLLVTSVLALTLGIGFGAYEQEKKDTVDRAEDVPVTAELPHQTVYAICTDGSVYGMEQVGQGNVFNLTCNTKPAPKPAPKPVVSIESAQLAQLELHVVAIETRLDTAEWKIEYTHDVQGQIIDAINGTVTVDDPSLPTGPRASN